MEHSISWVKVESMPNSLAIAWTRCRPGAKQANGWMEINARLSMDACGLTFALHSAGLKSGLRGRRVF